MTEAEITKLISDALFLIMCWPYIKLTIAFIASLPPEPKRKKRKGGWWEDESRGK